MSENIEKTNAHADINDDSNIYRNKKRQTQIHTNEHSSGVKKELWKLLFSFIEFI